MKLLLILIISVLKSHGELQKCCANNEIVIKNETKYECSDVSLHNFTREFIPLKINVEHRIGIPVNCTGPKKCVDKTEKSRIIELRCEFNETKVKPVVPNIHKCCPNQMFYNIKSKSCDFNHLALEDLIKDDELPMHNLKYGTPMCNGTYVDYLDTSGELNILNGYMDTSLINSDVIPKHIKLGTFCMDKSGTETVIRYCLNDYFLWCSLPNITCIRKCCPFGKHYEIVKGIPTCVQAWNQTLDFEFTDKDNKSLDEIENISILRKQTCYEGHYLTKPKPLAYSNGTILLVGPKNIAFDSHVHKYCVEHFREDHFKEGGLQYLVCFPPQYTEKEDKNFYEFIGLTISVLFLAATLTVYFFLPDLQNLHGKTVMCHTACLLTAYICLCAVKKNITRYHVNICITLGYSIAYTFFAAFCWLNVMCFDIWRTFGSAKARGLSKNGKKMFWYYCLCAFGIPVILTAIIGIGDSVSWIPDGLRPKMGQKACWFDHREKLTFTLYFIGPIGILILCNLVLFILTVRHCMKIKMDITKMQEIDSRKKSRFLADKATLMLNLKLFIVMGITWIFEVFSTYIKEPKFLWTILDVVNMLQGFFIFIIFVLKSKVWKALLHRMGYDPRKEMSTNVTSVSGKTSNASMISMRVNDAAKNEPLRVNVVRKLSKKRTSTSD